MKEGELKYKIQIQRYSAKKDTWFTYRDCDLLQNFRFANREFYLVYKNGRFFVCAEKKGDPVSVYTQKEGDGNEKKLPGEIVSEFRKKYLKNGITPEMLETFLDNPVKYDREYKKKNTDI